MATNDTAETIRRMEHKAVEIVLKEGPIWIPSLGGAGLNNVYALWDNITASEFFPEGVESAFYVLTLRKSVGSAGEVASVESELVSALRLLSAAWPFAGGSFVVLETRESVVSQRCESNADRVREELLAAAGLRAVTSRATTPIESGAQYDQPPLEAAAIIAKAAVSDPGLRRLLEYHNAAWIGYYALSGGDRVSWFIDLYKVRDLIKKLCGDERAAKAKLSIRPSDWSFFGQVLNNSDFRHAEVTGVVPPIARADVERLFALARTWIRQHLKLSGLPAR